MLGKKPARWRTLDEIEIALMKQMKLSGLPRDYIMSFFVRPGRVISSAVTSEVLKKFPEIEAATREEVDQYINRRIKEANTTVPYQGFGPVSGIRVREILQLTQEGQAALPGFESHFAEFKGEVPTTKIARAKIAKSMAAFANNEGGYVFIGIENDGSICGLPDRTDVEKLWDELADVVTSTFTPFFRWERNSIDISDKKVAVAYVYEAADKPIVATRDCTTEIEVSSIYFRYSRSSDPIKAGDLFQILMERDRRAAARANSAAE